MTQATQTPQAAPLAKQTSTAQSAPLAKPETYERPDARRQVEARNEAVAKLVETSIANAGNLKLTPQETEQLVADFTDDCFQQGAGGKESLIYIEHAALRDRFNRVLGMGQWVLVVRETWNENFVTSEKDTKGIRVYSLAMLVVRGAYVAEAVGEMEYYPSNGSQNYGDAFEGSKTAAFRRCAKEFGVGLQAWKKDWCAEWMKRHGKRPIACPSCGKETIIKGKAEYGGGWLCYQKKGGCGAKFTDQQMEAMKAAPEMKRGSDLKTPAKRQAAPAQKQQAPAEPVQEAEVVDSPEEQAVNEQLDQANGPLTETFFITNIEIKEGVKEKTDPKTKKTTKRPWKLWSITGDDNCKYGTFDTKIGTYAEEKWEQNIAVEVTYEQEERGRKILTIK